MDLKRITPTFTASPQLDPADISAAKALGFTTVINNRPDQEEPGQPEADILAGAAKAEGMDYHHIPVAGMQVTRDDIDSFTDALETAQGPVLAFCRSGTRSTMLWAISEARRTSADELIRAAGQAGYDLTGLRSTLEARHAQGGES